MRKIFTYGSLYQKICLHVLTTVKDQTGIAKQIVINKRGSINIADKITDKGGMLLLSQYCLVSEGQEIGSSNLLIPTIITRTYSFAVSPCLFNLPAITIDQILVFFYPHRTLPRK